MLEPFKKAIESFKKISDEETIDLLVQIYQTKTLKDMMSVF